jgi:hypothetical protein
LPSCVCGKYYMRLYGIIQRASRGRRGDLPPFSTITD